MNSILTFVTTCALTAMAAAVTGRAAAAWRSEDCAGTDACMESGGGTYENRELVGLDCADHTNDCGGPEPVTCIVCTYVGLTGTFTWCAWPGSLGGLSNYNKIYNCCIAKMTENAMGAKEFRCHGTNCPTGQTCQAGGIPANGSRSCNCNS